MAKYPAGGEDVWVHTETLKRRKAVAVYEALSLMIEFAILVIALIKLK